MIKKILFVLCFFEFSYTNCENVAKVLKDLKGSTNKLVEQADQALKKLESKFDEKDFEKQESLIVEEKKAVSDDWKKKIDLDFRNDLEFISNIILKGEVNIREQQDFKIRFKVLQKWFNKELGMVNFFYDDAYNALMQKKVSIGRVVKAQKIANEFIDRKSEQLGFNKKLVPRVKLITLYELNSEIQKKEIKRMVDELEIGLIDKRIKEIVDESIESVKKDSVEFGVDLEVVQNLISKLKEIKKELIDQDKMLGRFEALIKDKFIKKDKRILKLELLLKDQRNLGRRKIERQFKDKLKNLKKENLDLELTLKKNEIDAELQFETKLQEKLVEFKKLLTDKEKSNLELQLLIDNVKKEKNRLNNKINELKDNLLEREESGPSDQRLELEQTVVETEDKRLTDVLKEIESVEQAMKQEK